MDELPVPIPSFADSPMEPTPLAVKRAAPPAPPPRVASYDIVEDAPTEVDGPPDMTSDGTSVVPEPEPPRPAPASPPRPKAPRTRDRGTP
jgi:hypothetical protein